jgi:hypothetical protein
LQLRLFGLSVSWNQKDPWRSDKLLSVAFGWKSKTSEDKIYPKSFWPKRSFIKSIPEPRRSTPSAPPIAGGRPAPRGTLDSGKEQSAAIFLALLPAQQVDDDAAAREEHQGPGPRRRLVEEVADAAELVRDGGGEPDLEPML